MRTCVIYGLKDPNDVRDPLQVRQALRSFHAGNLPTYCQRLDRKSADALARRRIKGLY